MCVHFKTTVCVIYFRPQIKLFIEGLFSFDQDFNAFKEHLRDFLVQIRVRIVLDLPQTIDIFCSTGLKFAFIMFTGNTDAFLCDRKSMAALEKMYHVS